MTTEILFEQFPEATAEDRYRMISQFLREHQLATLEFTKKNGEKRVMTVTLDSNLLPQKEKEEFHQTRVINYETFSIWSTEDFAWRSFKTMNAISIKPYEEPKRWTVTVEEADDGSGDLVLPLPQDLLELQGWKENDTLIWKDLGNGAWQLSKKD